MNADQRTTLLSVFDRCGLNRTGSSFRADVSFLSGPDLLSGPPSVRNSDEVAQFEKIVGVDPVLPNLANNDKKLSNKVADYDAIFDHFKTGRDIFITVDTKGYFATARRALYQNKLNLIIQSPDEFVHSHQHQFGVQ
jgi:hypothetical protein